MTKILLEILDAVGQFFVNHLDKALLTALFLMMVGIVLLLVFTHQPNDVISWARELTSGFVGALLGLITGQKYQELKDNQKLKEKSDANKTETDSKG